VVQKTAQGLTGETCLSTGLEEDVERDERAVNDRRRPEQAVYCSRPIALSDTSASSLVHRDQRQSSAAALHTQPTGQNTTPSADQRVIALYGVLASRDRVYRGSKPSLLMTSAELGRDINAKQGCIPSWCELGSLSWQAAVSLQSAVEDLARCLVDPRST